MSTPPTSAGAIRTDQRTQAVLDTALDGVILMDAQGRIIDWNASAERIFGWSREEILGTKLAETIIPPVLRDAHERGLKHYLATGEGPVLGRRLELYAVRRDGSEFPVELSIKELPEEPQRIFVGFVRDITARKQAERALQESERRHRYFANLGDVFRSYSDPRDALRRTLRLLGEHLLASRCSYGEYSANGETVQIQEEYTDGCVSMLGTYRGADFGEHLGSAILQGETLVLNDTAAEILNPAEAARFAAADTRALICTPVHREGKLYGVLTVGQKTARAWKEDEVALVRETTDRVWNSIERVRAENELRDTAARFRTLADNISQLAWMAAPDGHIFWYNQRWFEYTGTRPQEMAGWGWRDVYHPDHVERVETKFRQHLATGEVWEDTFPLLGSNGEYRWFLSRARPIRNAAGEITLWFGTNTDVTEQREMTDELRAARDQAESASRAKDNFLAALSHELRTPLTPVLMSAAELREHPDLPEEVRQQLGLIQRNVELEARLIDDLLDLTRIARGRLPLRLQSCDAHSLIGLAVEIVRAEARVKTHDLRLELEAPRHGLHADPARLQQVFWNLLRNAVKFTPPGGRITIRTHNSDDGQLVIEFIDNGLGIRPEAIDVIFQPFEQAGLENDHRFGGLGLGLAIVRAIVGLHHGTIAVTSPGPNRGATFTVQLPGAGDLATAVSPEPAPEPATAPPVAPLNDASLRLLVVEDHEPTLSVLARLLTRAGHKLVTAGSIHEALVAAKQHTFDGVISDLGLPDGTGIDLMRQLRDEYGLRGIALSGYGMDDDQRRSREAGFLAHLVKPIDFGQLRANLGLLSPSV